MNYRRAYLYALACAACLVAAAILAGSLASAAVAAPRAACEEDQTCWTWSTMGNLDRGVYVRGRRAIRVVDPCTFAYLDHRGRIDWKRTPRLRGDAFARRHGCDPALYA